MIRRKKESFVRDLQTRKAQWTFTLDLNYTAGLLERNTGGTLRKASWEIQLWFAGGRRIPTGLSNKWLFGFSAC